MKRLAVTLFLCPVMAVASTSSGDAVPFPRKTPTPSAAVAPGRTALAAQLDGAYPPMTAERLDVGREALLVRANSGEVCGNAIGCPTAILVRQGASWRAIWTGVSFGRGAVLASRHAASNDILLVSAHGKRVLTYDGVAYREISPE